MRLQIKKLVKEKTPKWSFNEFQSVTYRGKGFKKFSGSIHKLRVNVQKDRRETPCLELREYKGDETLILGYQRFLLESRRGDKVQTRHDLVGR